MVVLRRGVLQCSCLHWPSPPALCCQLWDGEHCLVVILYGYTTFLTLALAAECPSESWMGAENVAQLCCYQKSWTRPIVQTVFAEVSIRKISHNHNEIDQHNLGPEKGSSKSALVCKKPDFLGNTTCPQIQDWNQKLSLWSGSASRTWLLPLGTTGDSLCRIFNQILVYRVETYFLKFFVR